MQNKRDKCKRDGIAKIGTNVKKAQIQKRCKCKKNEKICSDWTAFVDVWKEDSLSRDRTVDCRSNKRGHNEICEENDI